MSPTIDVLPVTAADLLSRLSESELANLIYLHGEERQVCQLIKSTRFALSCVLTKRTCQSKRIAKAIVRRREEQPFDTTNDLAEVIRSAVRVKHGRLPCRMCHSSTDVVLDRRNAIDPATRTFQALRAYINDEFGQLARGLEEVYLIE